MVRKIIKRKTIKSMFLGDFVNKALRIIVLFVFLNLV